MNAEWHVLAVVNYEQNERKATCFAKTKTNQGASAAARVQGGTRYGHEISESDDEE